MGLNDKYDLVSLFNLLKDVLERVEKLERNPRSIRYHSEAEHLEVDDHTQYLLADGTRQLDGDMLVAAGKKIDGYDLSVELAALSGHTHPYLPLAGGNLTGNVTANAGVTFDGYDIGVQLAAMANFIKCSDAAGYVVDVGATIVNCSNAYRQYQIDNTPTYGYLYYWGDVSVSYSQTFSNRQIPIAMAAGCKVTPLSVLTTSATFRAYYMGGAAQNGITVYYAIIGV